MPRPKKKLEDALKETISQTEYKPSDATLSEKTKFSKDVKEFALFLEDEDTSTKSRPSKLVRSSTKKTPVTKVKLSESTQKEDNFNEKPVIEQPQKSTEPKVTKDMSSMPDDVKAREDWSVEHYGRVIQQVYDKENIDHQRSVWNAKRRSLALAPLTPITKLASPEEIKRVLVKERARTLEMLLPNHVTLWIYNRDVLPALLYNVLYRYNDADGECFPALSNQFAVRTDASLLTDKLNSSYVIPDERLLVVRLGVAARNNYLPDVLNEVVNYRLSSVRNSRTIFLFHGSRDEFRRIYGNVNTCTLDRDELVWDWNSNASKLSNRSMKTSENVISRTVKTEPVWGNKLNTTEQGNNTSIVDHRAVRIRDLPEVEPF